MIKIHHADSEMEELMDAEGRIYPKPEIKAWREFSAQVEARLEEQHARGYTGWDDESKMPTGLLSQQLTDDAFLLERDGPEKIVCVDIAARAMMLHHRIKD